VVEDENACAVLWDMDGVLADTEPFHWQAWQRLSQEMGFPMSYDDFRRTFGWRNPELLQDLCGPGVSEAWLVATADRKEALYREAVRGHVASLPGVLELLQALQAAGFLQAVASAGPRENVDLILADLGIRGYFGVVLSGHDVERGKPDPQVFLRAAERLGVAPSRCVVIEDAVLGVRAARGAGMACLAVASTHPAEALAEADQVVASLAQVAVGQVRRLLSI